MALIAKNHYDDCPYGCNINGMLVDASLGKMVKCPYCSEKKKNLMRNGLVEDEEGSVVPLSTVLGIENEYLSAQFVYETVIPDGEMLFIDSDSVKMQRDIAEEMYLNLTTGVLPEESVCFGIGIKGRPERFAYPFLAKAYLSGLKIGKFITCSEYSRLAFDIKNDVSDFYDADFLMMLLNEGSSSSDIAAAKGLMQTRSLKAKPTVFLTTWSVEACSALLGYYNNTSLSLATPVFVEYKTSKNKKRSHYINKLLGVENEVLGEDSDKGLSDSVQEFTKKASSGYSVSMADLLD